MSQRVRWEAGVGRRSRGRSLSVRCQLWGCSLDLGFLISKMGVPAALAPDDRGRAVVPVRADF